MQTRMRRLWGLSAFVAASSLNPAYFAGCGGEDGSSSPGYTYGAAEMAKLVRSANDSFEFSDLAGVHYRLDLDVEPSTGTKQAHLGPSLFGSRAYACGHRTLVATASACIDSSSMNVLGSFALFRVQAGQPDQLIAADIALHGELLVASLHLSYADLNLQFDHGVIQLKSPDGNAIELVGFSADPIGPDMLRVTRHGS